MNNHEDQSTLSCIISELEQLKIIVKELEEQMKGLKKKNDK